MSQRDMWVTIAVSVSIAVILVATIIFTAATCQTNSGHTRGQIQACGQLRASVAQATCIDRITGGSQ